MTDRHSGPVIDRPRRSCALDAFVVLALVVTFLLRYASFLRFRLLFGPFLDNVHIYGPIFSEVSRLAFSGVVPYYLPDIGTGFPVFETPHFSILYPLYFFGLINYGGPLASLYTLTYLTLLHLFIFYLNLYVLLRVATISPWAAYIGASVGMLARNTELYASWITVAASYAWLPLVFAGAVLLLRFPGKAGGILTLSIAAGLLALASPSQSVIHGALSCGVLVATGVLWLFIARRLTDIWRLGWSLALCITIAFCLAGVAIVPMSLATGDMIRHVGGGAAVIGHTHIPWQSFNLFQLKLSQAIGILIKPSWISVVGSPYVGALGVIGTILVGIYFRRLDSFRRALAIAFGLIGLYALLSGFGTNLGLAYLNFYLPLVNRIREAGRHLVLFVISIAFLSGIGYSLIGENLYKHKERFEARLIATPALLALIFATVIVWEFVKNAASLTPSGFWILALAPGLFFLSRVWRLPGSGKVVLSAVVVSLAAAVIPVRGISVSQSAFAKPLNLLSHRVLRKIVSDIDVTDYRMDFQDTIFDRRFWGMNASYYSIRSFYNQLTPQPYGQFRFMLLWGVPRVREMMGARYVLCGPNSTPLDPNAKQILQTEGYRLYENPHPMERLTLLHRVAGAVESEDKFLNVIGKGLDYSSEAYVTPDDLQNVRSFLGRSAASADRGDRIINVVDQPNRSYSMAESGSPSLLILNEWFTPAWKARVNGKKQHILRINWWQTGVLLPAGKNRVEFDYSPTLFRLLMVLNRITMACLLGFIVFQLARRIGAQDRQRLNFSG